MQRLPLPVLITPFGELELMNAVQLRLFRKEVRSAEARAALAAFRADLRSRVFAVRSLPEGVFTSSTASVEVDLQTRHSQSRHHSRCGRNRPACRRLSYFRRRTAQARQSC